MAYQRKGGSGKSGSLREQFNYYKRQLQNRLLQEQAFKEARGAGTIEGRIYTLFEEENLNYEKVFEEGITRKVGARTIRYKGIQGVEIQIESLKKRSSKSYQAEVFINNYIDAMESVGFSYQAMEEVKDLLNSISIDKLTLIIDKGILPSIEFIYAGTETEEEFLERVRNAVKNGVTREELKDIKQKQKALVKVLKEKQKIIGW